MAESGKDHDRRIKAIASHSIPLPPEAAVPWAHYRYSVEKDLELLDRFEVGLGVNEDFDTAADPHLHRLYAMILLNFVEAFERFLKELAAACIDQVARYILDDRLDVFTVRGTNLAAHFEGATLGRALCESSTWLDCDQVNRRFRKILADPFSEGKFVPFPPRTDRYTLVEIVWQLRHTLVHNAGVITMSDASRLRLLTKSEVGSPRLLWPSKFDVWSLKLYLDSVIEEVNVEVAGRLSELLTSIWIDDPGLFDAGDKATELADLFGIPVVVGGSERIPTEE